MIQTLTCFSGDIIPLMIYSCSLPICISALCFFLFFFLLTSNLPRCSAAALQALKRKKRYEKQLAQIDGTLSTIEFQRDALENANTNTEVLKNIGYAAKVMKNAHANL